jgi:hypothetical protein
MVAAAAAVLAAFGALSAQVDAAAGSKASAGKGSSSVDGCYNLLCNPLWGAAAAAAAASFGSNVFEQASQCVSKQWARQVKWYGCGLHHDTCHECDSAVAVLDTAVSQQR